MSRQSELAQLGRVFDNSALSNRNMIINGSHIVNQRGITSVTTGVGSSTFTTDRWISYGNGQAVNITIQEVTLPDGTVVNSHKTTATTSLSSVFLHPFQKVEAFGKGHLRGKPVTISTWVRTNMTGQRIRICDTTACYELGDEIPSDGDWYYITATHTMPSNMAIGASDQIQIHPAFGNTNTVSGSYIEFTLTQFEVGDTATPFEHRSYGQELALCQRYFQRFDNDSSAYRWFGNGYSTSSTAASIGISLKQEMRSIPTVTTTAASGFIVDTYAGASTVSSISSGFSSRYIARIFATCSGIAANWPVAFASNGDSSLRALYFDAEL